ncbi:hypothetical protein AB3Y40_06845 [Yoonia sp. R2331]|uniref:hypothetical protein n=1 Tax=Yoonia sp. R2331 TaxID=3237238 RepID=UPI0034E41700
MNDDFDPRRKTPPEDHEWPGIWEALEKSNKGWIITGPIHAVATNWKALLVIAGIVLWINSPELVAYLRAVLGG